MFKTCISFSAIHTSLHVYWFIMASCVLFSWISPEILAILQISFHPMIFIMSSVILLSLRAFRILEYLLGYFLEILCMKILLCLCVGLIFYALWIAALLIFLFGIHLTAVLNTTLYLELIGSNGIFGSISGWYWFRNMAFSGTQHNVWQMHPLENWLLL